MTKLVVASNIKDCTDGLNTSLDFADNLNKVVEDIIRKAVVRAKANGRKTVQAKDL